MSAARRTLVAALLPLVFLVLLVAGVSGAGHTSKPGGAGHALLFRNHALVKTDFKDFPTTAMTFEAWVSSSDFCNAGTILSYAKDSKSSVPEQRVADFNHFVIFDPRNLLACHDFQYIDLRPDPRNESCHASYKNATGSDSTASLVKRDGKWQHLAVTWSTADEGLTHIYINGLLMSSAYSQKTKPLEPGGAFMLGGEQDCFGGCTDPSQGFNGLLDEVRIWRTVRSQEQILKHMRWVTGLENEPELVAYWKFNEPDTDEGQFRLHTQALDASGHGNHLPLLNPPHAGGATIQGPLGTSISTGVLTFRNNFAINKQATGMPDGSFTLELWARGAELYEDAEVDKVETLLSFATQRMGPDGGATGFMDDAIRLERMQKDVNLALLEPFWATSTLGSVRVHINSNEHEDASDNTAWLDFDVGWKDSSYHHIALTWDQATGHTSLYYDGVPKSPFWRNDRGLVEQRPVSQGGVEPHIAAGSVRGSTGALVLGQDQDCYGGCFQASHGFKGDMGVVRIWRRVLSEEEIKTSMLREHPAQSTGLAALYIFNPNGLQPADGGGTRAMDASGSGNHLTLRSDAPLFEYSTAPLALSDGRPVKAPVPGAGGYSLSLSDQQVLLHPNFRNFPSTAITVEFWMWSVDGCRKGVPFSYALGSYHELDNAFLLFNYNSFGVSVMEDEGHLGDHTSGVGATDGHWHHIAVTWESSTGKVVLYDNSRPVWRVYRGQGKTIPSGGTLVIGREQDCMGGCFDSAAGAAGQIQRAMEQEYGVQDFFGVIEEMRVWRVARTADQIRQGMDADDGRGPGGFTSPGLDPKHPDLVAYYKFDEGSGYTVKDVTGNGHDLQITQSPPGWLVTRWLSTCGNGIVEGEEECDDGDLVGGNGCSPLCRVEPGWGCSGNPSICRKLGPTPDPHPAPTPSGGGSTPAPSDPSAVPATGGAGGGGGSETGGGGSSKGRGRASWLGVGVVLVCLGLVCVGGVMAAPGSVRRRLAGAVPQAGERLSALLYSLTGGRLGSSPQAYNAVDPEMHSLLAPDFLAASPATSPPGHPGHYDKLPDRAGGVML